MPVREKRTLPETKIADWFVVLLDRKTTNQSAVLKPAQAIEALESRFGVDSPFDFVHKLNALVKRALAEPKK